VSSAAFGCQRSSALAQADQAYMALMEIVCSLDDYLQDMQVRLWSQYQGGRACPHAQPGCPHHGGLGSAFRWLIRPRA
jgi:hypothetical protein